MNNSITSFVSAVFSLCLLMLIFIAAANATISQSQQTGVFTEGWDGPGLGSATIPWYLGWNDNCAAGDRGVTTDGSLSRAQIEAAITAAMDSWSSVVDIQFVKVGDSSLPGGGCIGDATADNWDCDGDPATYQINIFWASGDHCDGAINAFDGPWNPTADTGSVFAHSWGPPDIWDFVPFAFVGNVHLDDGDHWVTSGATDVGGFGSGLTSVFIDIESEILHELGHSIGLGHPPFGTNSIMEALSWNLEQRVLSPYDISEIQKLYASPSNNPAVALVFDLSGSMGWGADGNTSAPADEQRLSLAKRAAKPFLELLHTYGADVAEFAIAGFKSSQAGCLGNTESPMTVINNASLQAAIADSPPGSIDSMTTGNNTPLLAGVEHAISLFSGSDKKAIVLLSDGYHNCPAQVSVGDPAVNAVIAQLNAQNIVVNTIGFGRPSDIDHPLLETLAANTSVGGVAGYFYDVTVPGFDTNTFDQATALQSTYKDILTNHLNLQTAVDPLAIAQPGSVLTREIKISPYDRKVSFFVSWKTLASKRLSLEVRSSDGLPVPTTAAGVELRNGLSYAILTVDNSFLAQTGKVGTSPWTLTITANTLKKGETEPFQYSVVMDSRLKLTPILETERWNTGSKITVRASIRAANQPVIGLTEVFLDGLQPSQGIGTWYATNPVDKNALKKFATDSKDTLSPLAIKAQYLIEKQGVKFPALTATAAMRLYDDATHGDRTGNDGVYTNVFDETRINGTYTLRVRASGSLPKGGVFEREASVKREISALYDPDNSKISVAQMPDRQIAVTIMPLDTLNNYIGPGYAGTIQFTARQAEPVGALEDNLDGSYTQVFKLAASEQAGTSIKVTIGDRSQSLTWMAGTDVGNPRSWSWLTIMLGIILLFIIIVYFRRAQA